MHVCGNVWVHVCGFWVQSIWKRLGACMRLLGAKYAVVGCKSMETFGMVWDLSRSVPMVFRSPGNTLINLFHFIFNSKCHFS